MKEIPKRRKADDNPYELSYSEEKGTYIVTFKDGLGVEHNVDITDAIYYALSTFELEDISQMHKYERHIEHYEIPEYALNKKILNKELGIEEKVISNEENRQLKNAIKKLSKKQQRRVKMYFFEEASVTQIAEKEKCTHQAVSSGIRKALKDLKKFLK